MGKMNQRQQILCLSPGCTQLSPHSSPTCSSVEMGTTMLVVTTFVETSPKVRSYGFLYLGFKPIGLLNNSNTICDP